MRVLLWVCMAGCAAEPAVEIRTEPLRDGGTPPTVSMSFVRPGVFVTPGTLRAVVEDADQAASTVALRVDGLDADGLGVFEGNADGDGVWEWTGELPLGDHELDVELEDRSSGPVGFSIPVFVRTNEQPRCEIVAPLDGTSVIERTDIQFEAVVSDGDADPLAVLWRSDVDGALVDGTSFVRRLVTPGTHVISIEVSDALGPACTDRIRVQVQSR
ncbi:MAG: hypothetical protein AB8H79_07290 [Myxococcota bacterium]